MTDGGGSPLAGVKICVWTFEDTIGSGCTSTGSDGTYALYGLPAGEYRLQALLRGYEPYYFNNVARWVDAMPLSVPSAQIRELDATMRPGGIIEGRVYAADGVTPLENVSVKAGHDGEGTCTRHDGSFTLPVSYGSYLVYAPDGFCDNDGYIREWWQESASEANAEPVELSAADSPRQRPALHA